MLKAAPLLYACQVLAGITKIDWMSLLKDSGLLDRMPEMNARVTIGVTASPKEVHIALLLDEKDLAYMFFAPSKGEEVIATVTTGEGMLQETTGPRPASDCVQYILGILREKMGPQRDNK